MKTTSVIFVFCMVLVLGTTHGVCQSIGEIVGTYDRMVNDNIDLARKTVPSGALEGREPLKNLFYLRPRGLNGFLFENLTFSGTSRLLFGPYSDWVNLNTNIEFKTEAGMCPSYLVLLGSGVNVKEVFGALLDKKRSVSSKADMIGMLGRRCSGSFFDWYVKKLSETDEYVDVKKILDAYLSEEGASIRLFLKAEKMADLIRPIEMLEGFQTVQGRQFEKMEKVLVERLLKEMQSRRTASVLSIIAAMGHIRSLEAVPLLAENLTICPQVSTNAPSGYTFPAAEALIEIGPAIGYCFGQLEKTKPLSVEESLWLRISHELYPEGLEYDLMRRAETNDFRAARLLGTLPWRRLDANYELIGERPTPRGQ